MIDFHSHVLPQMDDGSRSVKESEEMLLRSAAQGVSLMAATPHFYPHREDPEAFLARRDRAFSQLLPVLRDEMPKLLLGAEVYYFPGMYRAEALRRLTLAGSNLLLVELPFAPWTEQMLRELLLLEDWLGVRVVIAHMERYKRLQRGGMWEKLLSQPLLFQINAGSLNALSTRHGMLRLLAERQVQFLGSDCHNLTNRSPNMGTAATRIERALGAEARDALFARGRQLIAGDAGVL